MLKNFVAYRTTQPRFVFEIFQYKVENLLFRVCGRSREGGKLHEKSLLEKSVSKVHERPRYTIASSDGVQGLSGFDAGVRNAHANRIANNNSVCFAFTNVNYVICSLL